MNILYTITGLTLGGAETITVNLAERMHKLGHKVCILFLSGEQIVQVPDGIDVINLDMKKNPLGFVNAINKAKKIVNQLKPDVVHANMFHAIIFSRLLRIFIKIPRLICTEHSNNFHGKLRKLLEHCTDFLSDLNTNVSEKATSYFVEKGVFSQEKSLAMYNGVDLNRFCKKESFIRRKLGLLENDFVFINVSRFNEAKDHKTLMQAFLLVNKKHPNARLLCIGDGELLETIKEQAVVLGLSDKVLFLGSKFNTEDYYNASDCFVLSSAWEGFGLVLVEAMACELPAISTDCGGTKEIMQQADYLVPIRDPVSLSNKMLEVMNLPKEMRNRIGQSNRKLVEKFDLNMITDKWVTLYSSS